MDVKRMVCEFMCLDVGVVVELHERTNEPSDTTKDSDFFD
jgi:hypothetical protein